MWLEVIAVATESNGPGESEFALNDPLIHCFWVFFLFRIMTYKFILFQFDSSWLICLMVPCFCFISFFRVFFYQSCTDGIWNHGKSPREAWHVSKFSALVGAANGQLMGVFGTQKLQGVATWKVACGWILYFWGGWRSFCWKFMWRSYWW